MIYKYHFNKSEFTGSSPQPGKKIKNTLTLRHVDEVKNTPYTHTRHVLQQQYKIKHKKYPPQNRTTITINMNRSRGGK